MELLLALSLLVLLTGVATLAVGAFRGSRALEEGATRIESAVRLARADAANQGKRLRLLFTEIDARPQVQWEADPLTEPGQFTAYTACTWQYHLAMDGLRVERCELVGASTSRPADWGAGTADKSDAGPMAITFQPDGSCDSAVIELSAVGAGDSRRAVLTIDGLTGLVSTQFMAAPHE
jgi:hypothetical protein